MSVTAQEFFNAIFRHAPKDALVQWGLVDAPIFPTVEEILEGATDAVREDIFYSPAIRSAPTGYKTDTSGSGVVWVDLDTPDGAREPLLPPSIVVHSGRPGGKHYYWLLDKLTGTSLLEKANSAMIEHINADKGTHNCNRVLRVPGSINTKYGDRPSCEVVEFHPTRVYSANDIAKLHSYEPDLLEIPEGLSRSERDFRLMRKLASWGLTRALLVDLLYYWSDKAQSEGDHYVNTTISKVVKDITPKVGEDEQTDVGNVRFLSHARLIGADGGDKGLVIRLEWENHTVLAPATQDNFKSRRDVLALLSKYAGGTRIYRGSDLGALKLWEGLVEDTPDRTMLAVEQSGRYDLPDEQRIYIYATGTGLSPNGLDQEVFWAPMIETPNKVRIQQGEMPNTAEEITRLMMLTQPPQVLYAALGWMAATVFKTVIEKRDGNFPLMLLYGMQGSGKTSFIKEVLLPLVGVWANPISADITPFALTAHLTTTQSIPVWLNEYRASNKNTPELERYLRTAYDGSMVDRGRPDLSVQSFPLKAPIVIDGESIFTDPATRDRTISLQLGRQYIEPGTQAYQAFYDLRSFSEDDREIIAYNYLTWAIQQRPDVILGVFYSGKKMFEQERMGARAANNAALLLLGLEFYQRFLDHWDYKVRLTDRKRHIMDALTNTYLPGLGVRTPAEYFIEILAHQFVNRAGWAVQVCEYDEENQILWFGITTAVHYVKHFWNECPHRELLIPQLVDRVGIHLVGPRIDKRKGKMFGIDVVKARSLGLDIPTPKSGKRKKVTEE